MDDLGYLKAALMFEEKRASTNNLGEAIESLRNIVKFDTLNPYAEGLITIIKDLTFFRETIEEIPAELNTNYFILYGYYLSHTVNTHGFSLKSPHLDKFIYFNFKFATHSVGLDVSAYYTVYELLIDLEKVLANKIGCECINEFIAEMKHHNSITIAVKKFKERHGC